ncbi:LysE family transporter [soil metagenome]
MVALVFGIAMGVAIAVPVGPVAALCIERTFARGLVIALMTAFGAGVADALFGAIAAFGVGFVTRWVRDHEFVLRFLGAVVLFVLALSAWRKRSSLTLAAAPRASIGASAGAFTSGFLLTASSPITIITFAVALASFGGTVAEHPKLVPLGVLLGSGGWYGALSGSSYLLRERVRGRMELVGTVSAVFLAACGVLSALLAARSL